jgi:pyruvate/2-oxoglutarate dehydrogenase complex dihydrolipoamide dehydrogenase (E3) component
MKSFDSVIIGSGQAGPSLSVALATRGQRVALVEGASLGGTCVNTGCTPTKTLRKSARVAHMARHAAEFGVRVGEVEVDFGAAMARMRARSDASRSSVEEWLAAAEGVEVIRGWGRFEGRDGNGRFIVGVGEDRLVAERVFLNTGTRAFVPPVPGLDEVPHLDNAALLALTERPAHLVVVGGSYIGLEMGQMFRRLGSEVTLIHRSERLAEREDDDVSGIIADFLREEGVALHLNAGIARVGKNMRGIAVTLEDGTSVAGSHLLFATGRVPNTEKLNVDSVGLKTDARGYIPTDAKLRTEVPGIWALGDVNRRGAFTHTSYHDHEIVLADLDERGEMHQLEDADRRPATYAMFTDPPLGRVGLSLGEARALARNGRKILVAEMPMAEISRAKEESESAGLIRLIVDGDTEAFLGATVLGLSGDEVIAVLSNFMATGASYKVMQQALPVHPTIAELLPSILARLAPLAAP